LLDLSLQADDTSLGGVLDEIYSPEGEQEQQEEGKIEDVAAETEDMFPEQQAGQQPGVFPAVAVEPAPDASSNAFGISLFLPFVAVLYTFIVIVASITGTIPSIFETVGNFIWYVCGGLFIAAMIIIGIPAVTSGGSGKSKKAKSPKKDKKAGKAEKKKAKKEKKDKKKKKKK
jgi:hypothetical protein